MVLTGFLCLGEAAISGYAGYFCFISVRDMMTWEDTAKKASKYSNAADEQLWKTRQTLAAGAISVICSLCTTGWVLIKAGKKAQILLSALNVLVALGSRFYVEDFWRGKMKVPLAGNYNEAITTTNKLRELLASIALIWVGIMVAGVF